MKISFRSLVFVPLIGLIGVMAANAQITESLQFQTSFPFTVGNTTFQAGKFTIEPADDGEFAVMRISDGTKSTLLMVEPEAANPNQEVKDEVVFQKYGDQYVLSEIWDSADGTGAHFETPTAQRLAEQNGQPAKESVSTSRPATRATSGS